MKNNPLNNSGVYSITNNVNGKRYIGSCSILRKRRDHHFGRLRLGKHHNRHLQSSFEKYGESNFSFDVLEVVEDKNQLPIREQFFIDNMEACSPDKGYNFNPKANGSTGAKRSQECKEKHRRITTAMWGDINYRNKVVFALQSQGHRESVSNIMKEVTSTPEAKKRLSENAKNLWQDPSYREKMSRAKKGLWDDPVYRQKCLAARFPKKYGEHSETS